MWLFRPAGERVCVQSNFPLRRKLECSLWSLTAHTITHMRKSSDSQLTHTHTQRRTSLPLTHGLTCMHTHCACLSLNNQRMPACLACWLACWMLRGKSDMNPVWCLFLHSIIQLGGRMARALLHTPVRSCAKSLGHRVIVRGRIHYMMLPACTDKKRQGVTYEAS